MVLLKEMPKIEFHLLDDGFQLYDEQTIRHTGRYAYEDIRSIELNKPWFPRFAKWLRALSWIMNGVPLFPDAEIYKRANLIIQTSQQKIGIWITDATMADKAKEIVHLLKQKNK